ncbi:MAG: hypothetical protein CBC42_05070 [Betaproteobacteria bacterium TMED82]|nr:MAG: hypothetical protein CBC42_05070 [Betaproteobacteria bacterium TMED82]|tara:strand:- start:72211 stop:72969 length:759 start_codon:yes stop_codon:yes gene_type:complete
MQVELWWLISLPFLFIFGWISSRWDGWQDTNQKSQEGKSLEKVAVLLAKEDRDQALKLLLEVIRENALSLNLQQALGTLYRSEGFFDKAIAVHVSLLSKENIGKEIREEVILELAKDYICAGIFDRARSSLALIENSCLRIQALELQLKLAQRLRFWKESINYLELIEKEKKVDMIGLKVHLLCELAIEGDPGAFVKAERLNANHLRVLNFDSSHENTHGSIFICNSCGARFGNFVWRCHVCEAWDACEKVI